MIRYSCDCCGRDLDPSADLRYVVKLEAYAVLEPVDTQEIEDDRDHLLEIHEILQRAEDADDEAIGDDVYQRRHFDLCNECFKKFNKDPFGREITTQLDFSQN